MTCCHRVKISSLPSGKSLARTGYSAASRVRGNTSFCFQAEDGIRDLVRSRGLGDVYKRQLFDITTVINCIRDISLKPYAGKQIYILRSIDR